MVCSHSFSRNEKRYIITICPILILYKLSFLSKSEYVCTDKKHKDCLVNNADDKDLLCALIYGSAQSRYNQTILKKR